MSEQLNYVRQLEAFFKRGLGELKPAAIALYTALFHVANAASCSGGVDPNVRVDNRRLLKLTGIGNEKTLAIRRNELIERGFIEYQAGGNYDAEGNRLSGLYHIVKLYR